MNLKTKFFGTKVAIRDLQPGDLAFADSHNAVSTF